jgi:hypothetical protein
LVGNLAILLHKGLKLKLREIVAGCSKTIAPVVKDMNIQPISLKQPNFWYSTGQIVIYTAVICHINF